MVKCKCSCTTYIKGELINQPKQCIYLSDVHDADFTYDCHYYLTDCMS